MHLVNLYKETKYSVNVEVSMAEMREQMVTLSQLVEAKSSSLRGERQ